MTMLTLSNLATLSTNQLATAGLWTRQKDSKQAQSLVIRCSSTVTPPQDRPDAESLESVVPTTPAMAILTGIVNAVFSYKPLYKFAANKARSMIMERGEKIGYPWPPTLEKLRAHDWESEMKAICSPNLQYPDYYLKPFHGYDAGNLSWDAALEAELAAKAVHANAFDPKRQKFDPEGDRKLRDSYHEKMCSLLDSPPRAIVDIGCATGLSTFGLHQVFPDSHLIGVDLSPYFLSVANYQLARKAEDLGKSPSVHFMHGAGEFTGLPSGAFDLVSMCLVCHELPRQATRQIIEEANRLLRPGGALSIMEMNPYSAALKRLANNVVTFTAFKSTEPYFDDYRTFYIEGAIHERGFTFPKQLENSPRHRTIVAFKR